MIKMIIKDKSELIHPPRPSGTPQEGNKSRSKILVLGLILFTLVGFFNPIAKVIAGGVCNNPEFTTKTECEDNNETWGNASPGICIDPDLKTETECLDSGNQWNSTKGCWNDEFTIKKACEDEGNKWDENSTTTQTPATTTPADKTYHFLAPLPCTGDVASGCKDGKLITFDPVGENKIGGYLNLMIKIFIGICAVLAVIMIVIGGMQYMMTELISGKEAGRERITHAIFGLLLALGAWVLLNQINPDILKTDLKSLKNVTVEVSLLELQNDSVWQSYGTDKKYTNGNIYGETWLDGKAGPAKSKEELATYGASVYNSECKTVGQPNCTSTAGLDLSILKTIHDNCKTCVSSIQGGTEFWAHGGNTGKTSHQIGSPTMDLGLGNDTLNNYIKTGTQIATDRWKKDGVSYFKEGTHWHVYR